MACPRPSPHRCTTACSPACARSSTRATCSPAPACRNAPCASASTSPAPPCANCLKVLANEGLVDLLPNRGARIATLADEHLIHLFEVIAALEAEAGRLACERITGPDLAEIKSLHYRMEAHFLRAELPEYFALNQAIHAAILAASANPVLAATYNGLAGRIARARYMSNRLRPDRWQSAMDEHAAILDALTRRDAATLPGLLTRHLQNKRDIIIEALRTPAA